jgi:hypothetical protein
LTGGQIEYAPYQEVGERFPEVPRENFTRAVQLILPDGEVLSAAHAVFRSLAFVPGYAWMLWAYQNVPGFAVVAEWFYRRVAAHRSFFYQVTVLLWGKRVEPVSYEIATRWFLQCLGVIYLVVFVSLGVQITGLVGARGILPAAAFLDAIRQNYEGTLWWRLPTLFWLNTSDIVLKLACVAGAIMAVVIVLGFARRTALAIAFVLYLSLVHIGQTFLGYQWDYLLLETGFLAIFLVPTLPRVWLFRWLLFRLMLLSGTAKLLSGDPTWRNLTALQYHYVTQPLPTRFAWYFHHPPDFQKLSAVFMFSSSCLFRFYFSLRAASLFRAGMTILLQILIFFTGNYTFFNLVSVALCLLLFDDAALRRLCALAKHAAGQPVSARRDCGPGRVRHARERFPVDGNLRGHDATARRLRVKLDRTGRRQYLWPVRGDDHVASRDYRGRVERRAAWLAYDFKYKPATSSVRPPGCSRISPGSTGRCGSRRSAIIRGTAGSSISCCGCSMARRMRWRFWPGIHFQPLRPSTFGRKSTITHSPVMPNAA